MSKKNRGFLFRLQCLLMVLLVDGGVAGQPVDFLAMSPEELAVWCRQPTNWGDGGLVWDVWQAKRMDLIDVVTRAPAFSMEAHKMIEKRDPSDFKDAVTLQMLRNNAYGFPTRDELPPWPPKYPSQSLKIPLLIVEPYRSLVTKYLPGIPLEDRLLTTNAMRHELAGAIEEAKAHPEKVPEIIARLRAMPTMDPEYNAGEGWIAPDKEGDYPWPPPIGPVTPEEKAQAAVNLALWNEKVDRWHEEYTAEIAAPITPPPQPSLNPPPAPVNQSRPRAAASSWLLWTGLAGMNATVFLVLRLATRHLRQRGHGI